MRILYIGDASHGSTAQHRADALRRLGHEVLHIDPRKPIPRRRWAISLAMRTGFRVWQPFINRYVCHTAASCDYALVWVDCGAEVTPGLMRTLKSGGRPAINYNHDDPFGTRDGRKWDQYRRCLPQYDLVAVVREENIAEAFALGARRVIRVFRPCDPVAHGPLTLTATELRDWAAEVVFVGNWFPERGPFVLQLREVGVPVTVRGDDWQRAPEWDRLRNLWRGPAVHGADYVRAIQSSKVALGLLSKGNRDRHTTRSSEIPFMGGAAFCAERTDEHELLYRNGEEAMLWSNPEECAELCRTLLADEPLRLRMVAAARRRVLNWRLTNDDVMQSVLQIRAGENAVHPLVREAHPPTK